MQVTMHVDGVLTPAQRGVVRRAHIAALLRECGSILGVGARSLAVRCTTDAELQRLNRTFAGADKPTEAAPQMVADDLFLYPKNGQTAEQQSADRYECHSWEKGQSGFDPTRPGGGVAPSENADKRVAYQRAMTACLEARGYSVK